MTSDREPLLPPELERQIFEMASPEDHNSIILVARRTYEWIFPLQFHNLVFTGNCHSNLAKFLDLLKTKPSGFFAPHVNKLLLQTPTDVKAAPTLLPAFSSLQRLGLWSIENDPHVFDNIFGLVELKRLSLGGGAGVFFEAMRKKPESEPVLPNLTHLDVEFGNMDQYPDPICINRLQSLTHLSYSCNNNEFPEGSLNLNVQAVLNGASALRMLVLPGMSDGLSGDDITILKSDSRVVLVENIFIDSWRDDWTAHERGEPDFWDRAEVVLVASRKLQDK